MLPFIYRLAWGLATLAAAACVVILVVNNRQEATLSLEPLPFRVVMPMYAALASCFALGLCIGACAYVSLRVRSALEHRSLRRQITALKASAENAKPSL